MTKYWYQKQLRILQTVLRETDIINYDAKAVAEYMKKSGSNTLVVNAGGIIDFFHHNTKLCHANQFMKEGQEILADLCEELHKNDFRIITRIDFRGAQKYRYDAQPDWFAANADGSPKIRGDGLYSPCYVGEYSNGHAVRFVKNLMAKFPIDGIWENSVAFDWGTCYCRTCREMYKAETGKEIPVEGDYASPLFLTYRAWKEKKVDEHIIRIRDTVKSFGDDKAYSAEVFSMFVSSVFSGIDVYVARHFDYIVGVGFLTSSVTGKPYDDLTCASSAVRFLKAIDPHKTTVLLTGNNGTRWRLVKDPSQETRTWMWEAASVGANFWNCMFNGQYPAAADDRRNAYIETDVYHYLKENEELIQGQVPVTDVGIYFSKASRDKAHLEKDKSYEMSINGLEAVLVDSHIPYGFIADKDFTLEKASSHKVLCLPNTMCLSDAHTDIIKKYVENGGSLMASYKTSLFDENANPRGDFGLTDLFGLSYTGIEKDTSFDCYQMVRLPSHQITTGMGADKTKYFINGGNTLLTTPINVNGGNGGNGETVCSYVPIIPNQYPEQAYIRITETQFPTVYSRKYGKGQVVFFPNQMDALVYTNGHEDYYHLVRNSLNYLCKQWTLETDAPESVHAGFTKQLNSGVYILSFVNVGSSGRRAIRQLNNALAFSATLHLPAKELVSVKTLYSSDGEVTQIGSASADSEGRLEIHLQIPPFKEFIAVAVEVK
ncbi:MAG: hypothetical protein LBI14_10305 [Treponema sp.]|jgi:hypothetical protein|nr:hypothetical protein [Treponema sp.]